MSHHKDVAIIRDLIGYEVRLQPFESVNKVAIEYDNEIAIKIALIVTRVKGRESRGRFIHEKVGTELIVWTRNSDDFYWNRDQMILWSDSDTEVVLYGDVRTIKDVAEKREWEALCYRPGTSANPQDGPIACAQLGKVH